jgi:hypothetical protein
MKNIALLAIGLGALALSACVPRYYDDRSGRDGYYEPRGHVDYSDRNRTNDPYYANDPDQGRSRARDDRDRY